MRDSTGEARPGGGRAGAGRRTMVLILPFSVVMLSRWCRWAKGLAAPHDSRYRVMRTDALILAPSSVWRGLNRCCGLRRSPWGQETERHLRVPQAHACSPRPTRLHPFQKLLRWSGFLSRGPLALCGSAAFPSYRPSDFLQTAEVGTDRPFKAKFYKVNSKHECRSVPTLSGGRVSLACQEE